MARPSMVDAHIHLYDLDTQDRGWLSEEWSESQAAYLGDYTPIRRNYLVTDLLADYAGHDVAKAVHIQADWGGNQVDETRWLQAIADQFGFPHAIVAKTDLRRPDAAAELEEHLQSPNVRGIRMLAYEDGLFQDAAFRRGFAHLSGLGLTFDLGTVWQLMPQAFDLVKAFPDTRFILGHAGLQVWLNPRDNFGTGGVLSFSDSSIVNYSGLTNNGPLVMAAMFAPKTGITWMRVTPTAGTYSQNPGLAEAEAYEPGDPVAGAAVSQHVIEVALLSNPVAKVSQHVIEVAYLDDDTQSSPPAGGGGTPTVHAYGYASR